MTNESILSAAQKEKGKGKEFENKMGDKGNIFGSLIALIVGIILFCLEYFIANSVNIGLVAVAMAATGSQSLFEGIKTKKAFMIVLGIVQLLIAVFAILAFVVRLVTK